MSTVSSLPGSRIKLVAGVNYCLQTSHESCRPGVKEFAPLISHIFFRLKLRCQPRLAAESTVPSRIPDHTAEIDSLKIGILVGQDVRFEISERRFRLMLYAIVECLDNILLEMFRPWISLYDCLPISFSKVRV